MKLATGVNFKIKTPNNRNGEHDLIDSAQNIIYGETKKQNEQRNDNIDESDIRSETINDTNDNIDIEEST